MSTIDPLINQVPGEKQRFAGVMQAMLRMFSIKDDNLLPARVVQYDRVKNIATVVPLITWIDMSDRQRPRPQLEDVPVISIGGGNFHISFPIKQGDLGWIFAADRDMTQYLNTLSISPPSSNRIHNFEDCIFIPDVLRQYSINAEDADAMVIQSTDGASRVSIRADNIKITTPVKVVLDTPLVQATGDFIIDQNLTVTGTTTLVDETTVKGIAVSTHGHEETNQGRTAGGMVP